MRTSKCPLCGEKITLKETIWIGQKIECPACEELLEVAEVDPVSLYFPFDDDDLDDDYDDDDKY